MGQRTVMDLFSSTMTYIRPLNSSLTKQESECRNCCPRHFYPNPEVTPSFSYPVMLLSGEAAFIDFGRRRIDITVNPLCF